MEPASLCASCPCTESGSREEKLLALRPGPRAREVVRVLLTNLKCSFLDPLPMQSLRTWGPLSGIL